MEKCMFCLITVEGWRTSGVEGITSRFLENKMVSTPTTIQALPQKTVLIDGNEIQAVLMTQRTIIKGMFTWGLSRVRGYMAIYDITSRETFESSKEMIGKVMEHKKGIKIILVGNKCDLESKREVSYEEAHAFSQSHGILFIETSALCSININDAFYILIREIINDNTSEFLIRTDSAQEKNQQQLSSKSRKRIMKRNFFLNVALISMIFFVFYKVIRQLR